MSLLALGFDLETTGLDVEKEEIIEIGACLWDLEEKKPLMMQSDLVKLPQAVSLSKEITDITGITDTDLQDFGLERKDAYATFYKLWCAADVVVAHNGKEFDLPLVKSWAKRHGLAELPERLLVDTSCDVNFSASIKTRKLGHLAAEHGFLNPFAHRALFDVLTMLRVLSFYDHKDVIKLAGEKDYVVQALVEKPWLDSGKSTSEAKENGFRWNGERKLWLKRVKESQLQSVEKQGSYRVVVLEE